METKVCSHCGRELPVENFNKNKAKKDGLQSVCRECHKEMLAARYDGGGRKVRRSQLCRYSDDELFAELKSRSKAPLVNPTPRSMMEALAKLGYRGKLEYTQVHVIDINNF